jgi:AmmeMemoRadiSam system protein A
VTLNKKTGALRGCIGRIITSQPLYKTVVQMARAAAFHDSRFSPVKKEELDDLIIDITVLTPPKRVASYNDIKLGKHGIILKKGFKRSVFLPQVPGTFGWDLTKTLEQLALKAYLKRDEWKNSTYEVFEGFEFKE